MSADDDDFSFNLENHNDNDNDDNDNNNNNNNNNNNDDDDENDGDHHDRALQKVQNDIPALKFKNSELDRLNTEGRAWFSNMTCDPINCARRVVHILRLSDQRKQ